MTQRHQALAAAALLVAALVSTPTHARQTKQKIIQNNFDPHSIGGASQERPYARPARIRQAPARHKVASFTDRGCLDAPTRAVLDKLEARFGAVKLVKVCVPGARMPSGHVSWHARRKAFDFKVPKGIDQRDVMVWLTKNSPGVTISYRGVLAGIIHTDTGSFHKVIYAAADHEAGERAVAIWMERERLGIQVVALPPQRPRKPQARVFVNPVPWTMTAAYVEPDFEQFVHPPTDRAPEIPSEDRKGIFRRYVESKDVVVMAHTSLSCPNGKPFPPRLAQLPKDAAAHFGRTAYINSGYRTPERNRRVGGAKNSEHKKCKAIDWRVAGISVIELRRWVMARLAKYEIGGLGTYGSHLHTDARKATRLVTWTGGRKKQVRYAKHRKPSRYAAAG